MKHTNHRPMRIALVAHDNKKADLIEWAQYNLDMLKPHDLIATGTTGPCSSSSWGSRSPGCRAGRWAATYSSGR